MNLDAVPPEEESRRYFLALADLDRQLDALERNPGAVPAVDFIIARRAILELRAALMQAHERGHDDPRR